MNDERLARRAAAGDKAAFEAIFRRYHQDLYRYCLATIGNPQDAQDALQNTMVKAMQALPGEQREIKLKPWLYRVARNEAIETLRKRRDGVELDAQRETAHGEIAESIAARERLRQLLTDLDALPERQRSALVMRELAGLDFDEIGATFGTSPAVVRQTLYEARLSLRQMGEGREMDCESVTRALSDADGRVTRRRDLSAHLRGCASCRAFRDGIAERRGEFAAIAPLPLALSAGLLQALGGVQTSALGGAGATTASGAAASGAGSGAGAGAGGLAGSVGAGVGKTVATATIAKSAATVAVVAAVGVSAADRGGVIDLPLDDGGKAAKPAPAPGSPNAGGGTGGSAGAEGADGIARQSVKSAGSKQGDKGKPPDPSGSGALDVAGNAKGTAERAQSPPPPSASGKSQAKPASDTPQGRPSRGDSPAAGRPDQPQAPPSAAGKGQETAGAKRAPQANSPPGNGAAAGKTTPVPDSSHPPKTGGAAPAPPVPPAAAKGKGNSGVEAGGADDVEAIEP